MPRQVDHAERRRTIAEAIVRLVSAKGVEAASLRGVAAEAGVSMGAVQHYFATTDEMLLFALQYGNGLLAARLQDRLARQPKLPEREAVRLLCTMLLPLDAESRAGARLWAALIARGCVDEPTRKLAEDAYRNLTDFFIRWFTQIGAEAEEWPGPEPAHCAQQLVSVIEGLRWPLLFGVFTSAEALAVLDAQLDQLLPGPPVP